MRQLRWGIGTIATLMALTALQASPVAAQHGHQNLPDSIALPNGWQPEGITTDGKFVYSGSLADGSIFRADVRTGVGKVLATGAPGRVAAGLDFDKRRDLLWVVGGPTGEIRAQDADSGKVVATYEFPSTTPRFLNDVVVTHDAVVRHRLLQPGARGDPAEARPRPRQEPGTRPRPRAAARLRGDHPAAHR